MFWVLSTRPLSSSNHNVQRTTRVSFVAWEKSCHYMLDNTRSDSERNRQSPVRSSVMRRSINNQQPRNLCEMTQLIL
ncbi:hypothetical protein FRC20_002931 [Serendipita sp. 405]|nr:hypothetical protein FRC20_002931 [Serendipita sp. 405]